MSIKDEQVYEASKEILVGMLANDHLAIATWRDTALIAAKMAKLMADEIDDHPAHKRIR